MKSLFSTIFPVFAITALITHIWTVIIAFREGGIFVGIISLLLPVISEVYWMWQMFGVNDTYAWTALLHLLLVIPMGMIRAADF